MSDCEQWEGGHCDEEDIIQMSSIVTELKLQLLVLEKERDLLKCENKQLKQNIEHILFEEKTNQPRRKMSQSTRERWDYYHSHKKDLLQSSSSDIHWRDVKRETDKIYYSELPIIPRTS